MAVSGRGVPARPARRYGGLQPAAARLLRLRGHPPFPTPLIVHFGYHKCLTAVTATILRTLAGQFGFEHRHFRAQLGAFHEAVRTPAGHRRILSLNNHSAIDFAALGEYRGSHFVRDPRDLVVSGYHYHLWTTEPWCTDERFDWSRIRAHRLFDRIADRLPEPLDGRSYQSVLNGLDRETGMLLEIMRSGRVLGDMEAWDDTNPRILELKYEDIVGHEEEAFDRLFRHYGFHERIRERGLELVRERSLARVQQAGRTGGQHHVRSGKAEQWRTELSEEAKELFVAEHGSLLSKFDYAT